MDPLKFNSQVSEMTSLLYIIGSIFLLANAAIFLWALYEFFVLPHRRGQWASSKVLYPAKHNGRPSVILVHGFSGSPFDFKDLAPLLCDSGFKVIVPEVPAQGDRYFAYGRGRYNEGFFVGWLEKILETEERLTGMKPYIGGFSMGGALATVMAARGHVGKAVLISPYFDLAPSPANRYIPCAGRIVPVSPKKKKATINDTESYRGYVPGSMLLSMSAFRQLQKLAASAGKAVGDIDIPVHIVYSRNDKVASFEKTHCLFSGKANVTCDEYNRGNHILLFDYDRKEIRQKILSFFSDV
jgi:carboxylesterase